MIINTEIVDAYLNGEDISKYSSLFIYKQADRNIFQEPEKDKAEIVSKIKDEIIHHVNDFVPCNKRIWDTLFIDWQNDLDNIVLDLVVGCKEPNDAFVLKDLNGRHHMVFDLFLLYFAQKQPIIKEKGNRNRRCRRAAASQEGFSCWD